MPKQPYFNMLLHAAFDLAKSGAFPASLVILVAAKAAIFEQENLSLREKSVLFHKWSQCVEDVNQLQEKAQ